MNISKQVEVVCCVLLISYPAATTFNRLCWLIPNYESYLGISKLFQEQQQQQLRTKPDYRNKYTASFSY